MGTDGTRTIRNARQGEGPGHGSHAEPHPDLSTTYHIRIRGHLAPRWEEWFEPMTIALEDNGDTLLTGPIVDQAALHGILTRIRDLGLPLVSVTEIDRDPANGQEDITQ